MRNDRQAPSEWPWPQSFAASVAASALILAALAVVLWLLGRTPICKCGYVKLWHGVVDSAGNSQHIADWYTPSHVVHGLLFYLALSWLLPRATLAGRFVLAMLVEGAWEALENSPLIIERYRAQTISLDYYGDSIVNSLSDVLAMALGFLLAARFPTVASIALGVALEVFAGWFARDNLTLNVIMLVHPIDWIRAWQAGR